MYIITSYLYIYACIVAVALYRLYYTYLMHARREVGYKLQFDDIRE